MWVLHFWRCRTGLQKAQWIWQAAWSTATVWRNIFLTTFLTLSPGRDCCCPTKPFFSGSHAPVSFCGGGIGVALFISPAISLVSLTERVEVVTAGTPPGKQEHPPGRPLDPCLVSLSLTHTSEIFLDKVWAQLKRIVKRCRAAGMVWAEIKCCRRSGLRSSKCSFSLLCYCLATRRPSHRNCFKLISQIKGRRIRQSVQ